ncbi:cytochrome b [Polaromonas sp. YR568]|uniref:cytochrome b n=1 Tax=Polaromonas sp. YR568 TaxID=1855301 RepID=UPI003137B4E0
MPTPPRYTSTAIVLHWLLALLILAQLSFGVYMVELPFSPGRIKQFNWHKWAGISILVLSALRLLWRLRHRPPAALPMPSWQAHSAHASHVAMYVLFFAIPLAGWAYSSAAGFPVVYFGVLPLPDLVGRDTDLAGQLKLLHRILAYGLAALIAVHFAAALKHHLLDKDGLLHRMNPFRSGHA